MKIVKLTLGILDNNCYILWNEGDNRAVIVDPSTDFLKIADTLASLGLEPHAVLVTHCHFDHIGAVADLQKRGAKVYMYDVTEKQIRYCSLMGSLKGQRVKSFLPDVKLLGGETLEIAGLEIVAMHTPGHSPTSLCYIVGDAVFSGDTLFYLTYGRTDFEDGSDEQLYDSIVNKLFALEGNYKVFPGHGNATTMDFERCNNIIYELKC